MAATAKVLPFMDSFRNFLAGFGMPGRDKLTAQEPSLTLLTPEQLLTLYRSDWLARKICDIPAFDSTRAWRAWQAEEKDITEIERVEKSFFLQTKLMDAMIKARLFGGAALIMGIEGQNFNEELDLDSVKKDSLKFIHVVSKHMLGIGAPVRDVTSPWFGEPSFFMRSSYPTPPAPGGVTPIESHPGFDPGATLYIHPSRVVRILSAAYPDMELAPDAWGDSVLQAVYEAIQAVGLVNSSVATMIAEAKLNVIKLPGLADALSTTEGASRLRTRFINSNVAKSVINTLMLDANEEFEHHQLSLSGFDSVMQMYLLICCGAADVPSTRLLGREPSGMNATGDSDIRNYYDRLAADQELRITPAMSRLDEVLLRHTFGTRPEEVHYHWKSLWQTPDDAKAKIELAKAQAFQIDVNSGLFTPEALRDGRKNSLIESGFLYPGLEACFDEHGDVTIEEPPDELDIIAAKAAATNGGPKSPADE